MRDPLFQPVMNATGGSQQTYPISYPAGGTVVNDYFEVTIRNWNFCNPWNGSQTNPNYADARTDIARIVVLDAPPAPVAPDRTICYGQSTTLTLGTGYTPAGIITWYRNADKSGPTSTGTSFTPNINSPGTYYYWVSDRYISGTLCESPLTMVTLIALPVITNNTILDNQTACYNSPPAQLTGSLPAGGNGTYAYLWESSTAGASGPYSAAAGTNTGQNYSPPGLTQTTWFRRSVISGPCSNTSTSVQVTVRPTPIASISGTATVCQNQAGVNITFTNSLALPIRITYNIDSGGDLVQLLNANSSATVAVNTSVPGAIVYSITSVRYQTTPTCNNVLATPLTATVTVRPTPSASISGTTSVCRNAPSPNISFTNPMALAVRITYNINGGANTTIDVNANSTRTLAAPTGTAGTFNYNLVSVRYTTNPTCSYSITGTATVTVHPLPVPTITGPPSVCLNSTHNYTTEAGMTGYNWTVSSGGTINSGGGTNTINVTWSTSGAKTITVSYTNSNSCSGTSAPYNVDVGVGPTGANIVGSNVCLGQSSIIRVTINGGAPNYTILIPEYSATPILNYVSGSDINLGPLAVGPHTYTLASATDLCNIPAPGLPKTLTINVNPIPAITPGTNPSVCRGTTSASLAYGGATGSPDRYSIDYNAAANGAGFADVTNAVLPASPITLVVPAGAPAATYSANLTVSNNATGCVSATYPITVTVNPVPAITPGTNPAVCRGTTSASLTYGGATGSPDTYSIDYSVAANGAGFADVTNAVLPASPITLVVPAGAPQAIYTAVLTVSNSITGCVSTSYNITVTVNGIPAIAPGTNPSVCRGATSANLTYGSANGSPNRYSIDYDATANGAGFTDVTNAVLPASPIILVVPGAAPAATYSANLTVSNSATGCVSATYPITVTVNPIPAITPGANPAVCRGTTAASLTYGGATGSPNRYSLDYSVAANGAGFADVTNAVLPVSPITMVVPAAAPAAVYSANLTVSDNATGCVSATYPITVTVHPIPALNSGLTPPDVCSNTPFTYTATSLTPGTSFSWTRPAVAGITPAGPTSGGE